MPGYLKLSDFLAAHPSDPSIAPPLVHVTEGVNLPGILADGFLDPDKSALLEEDNAVYLSVGKPAFLLRPKAHADFYDAPVVFVFSKKAYHTIDRMFPMDGGAFAAGRYDNILGAIDRHQMEISPDQSSVAALIEVFFGTVRDYERSLARTPEDIRTRFNVLPTGFRVLALAALYSATRTDRLDDRKSTIEASSSKPVPIDSTMLHGIILPEEWLSDYDIRTPLSDLGCIVESYELYPIRRSHYQSELYRLTRLISRTM